MGIHSGTHVTRLQAQWWKASGWVESLDEHQPSLQTLHCAPHLLALEYIPWTSHTIHSSTPSFLSAHQRPSWALGQMPSQGLWKPCKVSCWQLNTFLAAAWRQRLHLLCPSHHALPCIQWQHGLRDHSNHRTGSKIQIWGSYQSQQAAGQRTGPYPHHLVHSVGHTQTKK